MEVLAILCSGTAYDKFSPSGLNVPAFTLVTRRDAASKNPSRTRRVREWNIFIVLSSMFFIM